MTTQLKAAILWGLSLNTVTVTNTYTLDSGKVPDVVVLCNFSAGKTVTAPAPTLGRIFAIVDIAGNAATDNITVAAASGNIQGGSTYAISDNKAGVVFVGDGTNFWVLCAYNGTLI
jgi:hypothetical protein